ncbi:MAG: hypothetical protein BWY36_00682 [Candidatus Diapherotrites archaeon ADurb.Bin253]|jgi:hypothetical protein|nr:MAG: hypothetical protein BWY36_00682 [Candidatus Diapherotrites archaeon ADurb.Bin253]HOC96991.1 hypothetical protein [Candidatus Pacearchaeota archaeon]HOH04158.1 hypothetical protein [Candidatus Pacearchaeota archaeon]HOU78986.1 hypothetical protein [Candidatus Pacearchaeota archaeon]HPX74855.1 hypothetical protein [Candidatus Pacearchaeota archaeon]
MSKRIGYNNRFITLHYSNDSIYKTNLKKHTMIEVLGESKGKNYSQVEQEAQIYLINDATLKKPRLKLRKIVGIQQRTNYDQENGGLIEIVLQGIAVFK